MAAKQKQRRENAQNAASAALHDFKSKLVELDDPEKLAKLTTTCRRKYEGHLNTAVSLGAAPGTVCASSPHHVAPRFATLSKMRTQSGTGASMHA